MSLEVRFSYKNHDGHTAVRHVRLGRPAWSRPSVWWWGGRLALHGWDLERNAPREYLVENIDEHTLETSAGYLAPWDKAEILRGRWFDARLGLLLQFVPDGQQVGIWRGNHFTASRSCADLRRHELPGIDKLTAGQIWTAAFWHRHGGL